MKRWLGRLVLVLLIGVNCGGRLADGQESPGIATPGGGPYPVAPPQISETEWSVPASSTGRCNCGAGQQPETLRPRPLLNRLGVSCWSHFNMLTCSSLGSDLNFVFGSCRTFFGEPCLQSPPPVPVPQGYGGTPIRYP